MAPSTTEMKTKYSVIDERTLELEEAGSPEVQERSFWAKRGKALTAGMLVAGAVCGTYYGLNNRDTASSKFPEYIPHSHPAFVNLEAVPVEVGKDHEGLCQKEFVQEVCTQFYNEATPFWDSADLHPRYVHAFEMAEGLSVNKESVLNLLHKLDIKDRDAAHPETFAFTCQELCERLVGSFPAGTVPAISDVACYNLPGQAEAICDVDVSPEELAKLSLKGLGAHDDNPAEKGGPPQTEQGDYGESLKMKKAVGEDIAEETELQHALQVGTGRTEEQKKLVEDLEHQPMDFRTLRLILTNLFRIFPTTADQIVTGEAAVLAEPALPAGTPMETLPDFAAAEASEERRLKERRLKDVLAGCQAAGAKAKAAASLALNKMEAREVQHLVVKWYGNNNDDPTRANVKRVLTGVQAMLNNVEYIYPGERCADDPTMYAYVFGGHGAPWSMTAQGQYKIQLCDLYADSTPGYQVETILHEGSHHKVMLNGDSDWEGGPGGQMYGDTLCKTAASVCAAGDTSACAKVLTNADTFEYFVADCLRPAKELSAKMAEGDGGATAAPAEGGGGSFR